MDDMKNMFVTTIICHDILCMLQIMMWPQGSRIKIKKVKVCIVRGEVCSQIYYFGVTKW